MSNRKMRVTLSNFILAATVVTCSALIGVNCSGFQPGEMASGGNGAFGNSEPEVPVAILTSEQMLKSMIAATGVEGLGDLETQDDLDISNTYSARSGSLPSVQSLSSATGPTLIALTNLAGTVCNKSVNQELASAAEDRLFYREINFAGGPSALTEDQVLAAFHRLARNAWRRQPTTQEDLDMIDFAAAYVQHANPTGAEDTRLFAVSMCTAVLSSVDAMTY